MISTSDEYLNIIRNEDQHYRLTEVANDSVWIELIKSHPELHSYIVFNKTLSPEVLFYLAKNSDSNIRWQIACKRKLNHETFEFLAKDTDSSVRERVALNPKTPFSVLRILAHDEHTYKDNENEAIEGLDNESISDIAKRRLAICHDKQN